MNLFSRDPQITTPLFQNKYEDSGCVCEAKKVVYY